MTRFYLTLVSFILSSFLYAPELLAQEDFGGNVYQLLVNLHGFNNTDSDDKNDYQAGPGSRFNILSKDSEYTKVRFTQVRIGHANTTAKQVELGNHYKIKNENFNMRVEYEILSGVKYGGLVVPFKYRSIDGTITGDATLGGYIGYWQKWLGVETTPFLSIGLSRIAVQDINAQNPDYKTGITYAFGIFWELKSDFQVGAIVGWDHLGGGSGQNWKYENTAWYTFGIGYKFGQ